MWYRMTQLIWLRYLTAILSFVLAVLVHAVLSGGPGTRGLFVTFYPAVIIGALCGGAFPGLLTTALCTLYNIISWERGHQHADWTVLIIFVGSCTLISFIASLLYHAEARAREADKRATVAAERERAAVELWKNESKYGALVTSSDDAIITKTLNGIITSWNSAAEIIYGYPAMEVIGKSISLLITPDHLDDSIEILETIAANERVAHYETVCLRKDGQRIDVSLTVSPLLNNNGEVIGASAIARDITARKQAEAERERLVSELQEALANVKILSGLLPICSYCKKIRNDEGYWQQLEAYLHQHSAAQFSHGVCPDCYKKVKVELQKLKEH